jgi:hypothetical protein
MLLAINEFLQAFDKEADIGKDQRAIESVRCLTSTWADKKFLRSQSMTGHSISFSVFPQ